MPIPAGYGLVLLPVALTKPSHDRAQVSVSRPSSCEMKVAISHEGGSLERNPPIIIGSEKVKKLFFPFPIQMHRLYLVETFPQSKALVYYGLFHPR